MFNITSLVLYLTKLLLLLIFFFNFPIIVHFCHLEYIRYINYIH